MKRSEKPPREPADWKLRNQKISCSCDDCKVVNRFAQSPDERELRLPLNKQRRQHLHNRIDEIGMEMTHETERKGSPYTLVLKKQRWSYKARLTEYERDKSVMRQLMQMASESSLSREIELLVKRMEATTKQK